MQGSEQQVSEKPLGFTDPLCQTRSLSVEGGCDEELVAMGGLWTG